MDQLRQEAIKLAEHFLTAEKQYRLGYIEAEQSNPKTRTLGETCLKSVPAGVRMLQSVDEDLLILYKNVLFREEFDELGERMYRILTGNGRIFISGCGATGRLAMCIEKSFRNAVKKLGLAGIEDKIISIMTGGDYALIRSVESFEDYASLSERQVDELQPTPDDLLIGVTATGETTSILGTATQALKYGAHVCMVVCTKPQSLVGKLERADRLYLSEGVSVFYLPCGGMAVTGSTRMQSSSIEMAVIMSALELALAKMAGGGSTKESLCKDFEKLMEYLKEEDVVNRMAELAEVEADLYRAGGYVTYFSENYVFDILTDTTERTPTFAVPPYKPMGKKDQSLSWAFTKNPTLPTLEAWNDCLGREARCISWPASVYESLGIKTEVPDISKDRLMEFAIGNEPDPEREEQEGIAVWVDAKEPTEAFERCAAAYKGRRTFVLNVEFHSTVLDIFEHLGMKMAMNVVSTSTMALMGRINGNYMSFLNMSNKKLVDRGARIVSDLCQVSYEEALRELYYSDLLLKSRNREFGSATQETIRRLQGEKNV